MSGYVSFSNREQTAEEIEAAQLASLCPWCGGFGAVDEAGETTANENGGSRTACITTKCEHCEGTGKGATP